MENNLNATTNTGDISPDADRTIIVAGATGDLGNRVAPIFLSTAPG